MQTEISRRFISGNYRVLSFECVADFIFCQEEEEEGGGEDEKVREEQEEEEEEREK